MTSCKGGEFTRGRKLRFSQDECVDREEPLEASLGDVKSKRSRFGPGDKWIKALKWESHTGQFVDGKPS